MKHKIILLTLMLASLGIVLAAAAARERQWNRIGRLACRQLSCLHSVSPR